MERGPRAELVKATIQIIAERGFEGLSVRSVAARAGTSAGAVQHHFPTKDALLGAAMTAIANAAVGRQAELESLPDPATRLHAIVDLLIPDGPVDPIARTWVAFAARAVVDDATREAYRRLWLRVRAGVRLLIAAASGRPGSAEEEGIELLALLDGLALSVVAEQGELTASAAREVAHRRVNELIRTAAGQEHPSTNGARGGS